MSLARLALGAALTTVLVSGCSCGGIGFDECTGDDQCPGGFRCDPDQQRCVRADGGNSVGDAARDAGAADDGGRHDSARVDGNRADGNRADATRVDAASRDQQLQDRVVSDLSRADSGGGGDGSAVLDGGGAPDTAVSPTDASMPDNHVVTPPTVMISPADGTVCVGTDTQLLLEFSEAMDHGSVELAFSLTRSVDDTVVNGGWSWNGRQAIFVPSSLLPGASHTALLAHTCRDLEGDQLGGAGGNGCTAPDQCSTFVVSDGVPATVSMTPVDGATAVDLGQAITLTFSEPMDQASVSATVTVNEQTVIGSWSQGSASTLSFSPDQLFGCSEVVTVTVSEGARDLSGLAMSDTCATPGAAFCSSFTTKPTHEECQQCSTGCWDVNTANHGCNTCQAAVAAPGDTPPCSGASWCLGCLGCNGSFDCSCATHCHYHREERFVPCNCAQVCS